MDNALHNINMVKQTSPQTFIKSEKKHFFECMEYVNKATVNKTTCAWGEVTITVHFHYIKLNLTFVCTDRLHVWLRSQRLPIHDNDTTWQSTLFYKY